MAQFDTSCPRATGLLAEVRGLFDMSNPSNAPSETLQSGNTLIACLCPRPVGIEANRTPVNAVSQLFHPGRPARIEVAIAPPSRPQHAQISDDSILRSP